MKAFFLLILLASSSLVFSGCESDLPPDPNAGNKLERGISGHGTITNPGTQPDALAPDAPNGGN